MTDLREACSVAAEVLSQLAAGNTAEEILRNIDIEDNYLRSLSEGLEQLVDQRNAVVLEDNKTWCELGRVKIVSLSDDLQARLEEGELPDIVGTF